MLAKDLAGLLMENPEAEVFYSREELYNGNIRTSITVYVDIFKNLDSDGRHLIEFNPCNV